MRLLPGCMKPPIKMNTVVIALVRTLFLVMLLLVSTLKHTLVSWGPLPLIIIACIIIIMKGVVKWDQTSPPRGRGLVLLLVRRQPAGATARIHGPLSPIVSDVMAKPCILFFLIREYFLPRVLFHALVESCAGIGFYDRVVSVRCKA